MKKRRILIVAAMLLATTSLLAQEPDAKYKKILMEWTVNEDNTVDYHYRHEVEILRNRALTAYADKGETFVVYNPDIEELTINEVYTVRKNGERVEMPQNAFINQLPAQCADCGRMNHMRELAMVHTGMEIGCTVVVDYTLRSNYPIVNEVVQIVRECPVEELVVNFTTPEGSPCDALLNNGMEELSFGTLSEQRTENSYRLTATDIPQTYAAPYMPTGIYPTLHIFNGTPQWTPSLDAETFAEAEIAMGQTMKYRSKRENVVAARDYVVENIHLNDIAPKHVAYRHATAGETWQSGCGTATDKAVLLAAILRAEGYRANVSGEGADQVSVMLDTLEYRMSVRSKSALELYGEAHDAETVVRRKESYDSWKLDTLLDGFYQMSLKPIAGAPEIDVRRLAQTRTAPLASQACDIEVEETIALPKGMTLVGGNISRKVAFDGIGRAEVVVKQSGKKLTVVRKLKLEQTVVMEADYQNFRQIMATWQSIDKITLRTK